MKARVLDEQADLFEIGVLAQTAEVQGVSIEHLLAEPSGPPVVIVGGLLSVDHLRDMRRLSSVLSRAKTALVVVPPFTDLDVGCYFETPVQLRVHRRSAEATARVIDRPSADVLGDEITVRSDHDFETALGAGVVALDQHGKPVLIRYQATNTSSPVFFSTLQLLTYTALTDEGNRQATLSHLLSWTPATVSEPMPPFLTSRVEKKAHAASESILVPVALLLAAGGLQPAEQLRDRAQALLGTVLSVDEVEGAFEELGNHGLRAAEGGRGMDATLIEGFINQRGLHPYVRELTELLAAAETQP